jgi:hypothetical protein
MNESIQHIQNPVFKFLATRCLQDEEKEDEFVSKTIM